MARRSGGRSADGPHALRAPYKPAALREYRRTSDVRARRPRRPSPLRHPPRRPPSPRRADASGKGLSCSKVRNVIMRDPRALPDALERDEVARIRPRTCGSRTATSPATGRHRHRSRGPSRRPPERPGAHCGPPRSTRASAAASCAASAGTTSTGQGDHPRRRGWDDVAGEIEPKVREGARTVPITALSGTTSPSRRRAPDVAVGDFVFGATHDRPFTPNNMRSRAADAWANTDERKRKKKELHPLSPIGLHDAATPSSRSCRCRTQPRGDRRLRRSLRELHDRALQAT